MAEIRPFEPFDDRIVDFLSALSTELYKSGRARALADVQTFAFWCRRANLHRLRELRRDGKARLGLGTLFHIAPSNVPVTFAYSFAFGLLAGNANIVRVPSRDMAQTEIIRDAVETLLEQASHCALRGMIGFVRYDAAERAITERLSAQCDGRIIWGGDRTIADIRSIALPARAVELTFPDRVSLCVMDSLAVANSGADALARLAEDFYNDTYVMDQNACSSPHLVLWLGKPADAFPAQERFWTALAAVVARRYALEPVQAVEKYAALLGGIIDYDTVGEVRRLGNHVYAIRLEALPARLDELRGRFGLFFEHVAPSLDALAPAITAKVQTLTYCGLEASALRDFVVDNRLAGIDRIVPVGKALDMDALWDGRDIIGALSRIIDWR